MTKNMTIFWGRIVGTVLDHRKTRYALTLSACIWSLVFSLVSRFTFSSSLCRSSMACCRGETRCLSLGCTCPWITDPQSHCFTSICMPHWRLERWVMFGCREKCQNPSPVWSEGSEIFSPSSPTTGKESIGTPKSKITETAARGRKENPCYMFFTSFPLYSRLSITYCKTCLTNSSRKIMRADAKLLPQITQWSRLLLLVKKCLGGIGEASASHRGMRAWWGC